MRYLIASSPSHLVRYFLVFQELDAAKKDKKIAVIDGDNYLFSYRITDTQTNYRMEKFIAFIEFILAGFLCIYIAIFLVISDKTISFMSFIFSEFVDVNNNH